MAKETALTYDTGSFKWSKEEYTLSEMLDHFADRKPFAFIVTQGYAGKEDVGADEMYWFHDIVFQSRVVGRDVNDDYLSIPLNYPHKVTPRKATGENGPLMTVGEMVRKNIYTTFEFQANQKHTIIKDASDIGNTELGPMEIIRTYDERFLAVHCLLGEAFKEPENRERTNRNRYIQEGVNPRFELMPVYMPIAIAIALDVCDEDTETFQRTMYDFKACTDKQPHEYTEALKKVADVMVFDEPPSDGDYEYIHILHFIKASTSPAQAIPSLPDRSKNQAGNGKKKEVPQNATGRGAPPLPPKKPNTSHPKQPLKGIKHLTERLTSNSSVAGSMSKMKIESDSSDSEDYEKIPDTPYSNMSKETPLKGRVGPLAMVLDPHVVLGEIHKLLMSGTVPVSTRKPKPKKPKFQGARQFGHDTHQTLLDSLTNKISTRPRRPVTPPRAPVDQSKHEPKPTPKPTPITRAKPPVNPPNGNRASRANGPDIPKNRRNVLRPGLKDISEILPTVDVSAFTMSDVGESLRLLNMSEYIEKFRQEQVDGDLLRELSVKDLVDEFGLTSLRAKKLYKFAHNWRPQ